MKEDFHQEDNDTFVSDFLRDNSSLPPRSTIHSLKTTERSRGGKIIRILFSSVIFIIIIALTVVFLFYDNFDFNFFTGEKDNPKVVENDGDSNIDNPVNEDEIIVVEDGETTGEEVIKEEETTENTVDNTGNQLPENNNNESELPNSTEDRIHIIQPGENLYRISLKYYGPGYMEELAKYNNVTDIDKLTAGYKLKIPSKELLE